MAPNAGTQVASARMRTVVARRDSESTVLATRKKTARYLRPSLKVSSENFGQYDHEADRPTSANSAKRVQPGRPPIVRRRL